MRSSPARGCRNSFTGRALLGEWAIPTRERTPGSARRRILPWATR
ncbi:Uncharacterized protein HZ326_29182, partial [Fusarium oxysporum f. sp. albedinis]